MTELCNGFNLLLSSSETKKGNSREIGVLYSPRVLWAAMQAMGLQDCT